MEMPDTVKEVTDGCFVYFSSGKSENIPQNADILSSLRICDVALGTEKVTISPKNKYCKIKDGCLLTKDGKEFLDIVESKKKIVIPDGVKELSQVARMRKCVKTVVIPKTVNNIREFGYCLPENVRIIISKKNKKYAALNGNIYIKKTKKMVMGKTVNGVLEIPNQIREIGNISYFGNRYPRKIVISENVRKIDKVTFNVRDKSLTLECKGITPPMINKLGYYSCGVEKNITVYVPKGCVELYKNAWMVHLEEDESLEFKELP